MQRLHVDLEGKITEYDTGNPVAAVPLGEPVEVDVNYWMLPLKMDEARLKERVHEAIIAYHPKPALANAYAWGELKDSHLEGWSRVPVQFYKVDDVKK